MCYVLHLWQSSGIIKYGNALHLSALLTRVVLVAVKKGRKVFMSLLMISIAHSKPVPPSHWPIGLLATHAREQRGGGRRRNKKMFHSFTPRRSCSSSSSKTRRLTSWLPSFRSTDHWLTEELVGVARCIFNFSSNATLQLGGPLHSIAAFKCMYRKSF